MVSKLKKHSLIFIIATFVFGIGNVWAEDIWPSHESELIGDISSASGRSLGIYLLEGDSAKKQIESFNQSIQRKKLSGTITFCRRIIDIPVGVGGGDHSYGGLCLLEDLPKKPEQVMICNDDLVGHLKIAPLEMPKDDIFDLSKFVGKNCFRG